MATEKSKREFVFTLTNETIVVENTATKEKVRVVLDNLNPETRIQAALFGVARKVTNVTAPMKDATLAEKWEAISEVANRLNYGGAWNGEREGRAGTSVLFAAMERVYGDSAERTEATLAKTMAKKGIDRKKAIAFWLSVGPVAKAVLEIKAERIKNAPNVDDVIDDLRA